MTPIMSGSSTLPKGDRRFHCVADAAEWLALSGEAADRQCTFGPGSSATEGLAGEWFSVKVSDGWIIGFNAGEFGAGLWWFSPDGKKREKISGDQVVGFFVTDAGLLRWKDWLTAILQSAGSFDWPRAETALAFRALR